MFFSINWRFYWSWNNWFTVIVVNSLIVYTLACEICMPCAFRTRLCDGMKYLSLFWTGIDMSVCGYFRWKHPGAPVQLVSTNAECLLPSLHHCWVPSSRTSITENRFCGLPTKCPINNKVCKSCLHKKSICLLLTTNLTVTGSLMSSHNTSQSCCSSIG